MGWRRLTSIISLLGVVTVMASLGLGSGIASAAVGARPGWELHTQTLPSHLSPGTRGLVWILLYNIGAAPSSGPITFTDTLPKGLKATGAGDLAATGAGNSRGGGNIEGIANGTPKLNSDDAWHCVGVATVTCTSDPEVSVGPASLRSVGVAVEIEPGASEDGVNEVTVTGGGAFSGASSSNPVTIDSEPAGFGLEGFDGWFSNANGTVDSQPGSHPYSATFTLSPATILSSQGDPEPSGELRDIETELPPGLVGDPGAVPQCTRQEFDAESCPASTQIGENVVLLGSLLTPFPVYNMVPPPGVPAQFAFTITGDSTFLDASVRSNGDYGITEHIDNVLQREVSFNTITLWGVPAEASHDSERQGAPNCFGETGCGSSATLKPFLTLPTSCAGPQQSTARVNSWQEEGNVSETSFLSHDAFDDPTGLSGCDRLGFAPSLTVAPDTTDADTPAGLTAEVKVSQEGLLSTEELSPADIRDTTVTLPEGVAINPGQAAGLVACQAGEDGIGTTGVPSCPPASKVGIVSIETPLLKDKLEGNIYVLQSNPPNLRLLVAASADGVNLKLVGNVHLDETSGRLTTTFEETPELPFTDFKLSFSGGTQAALATPASCGTYTTHTDFKSWAAPSIPDVLDENSFAISAGPGGTPCPSTPLPFAPTMTAGSTTDQAGGFTDFSLLLQSADAQQRIGALRFKTPEGLLGMIAKVPLCPEPQAQEGTCSAASQIGHTVVASGPGPYPLVVPQPGQPPAAIYLTGAYKGAPYGLSIVVPLVVGPFTLQTQIVRARIEVDRLTSQLTVTTDPLPQIVDGVPTDLRTINAVIDRPGFMFNPTSCAPMSFSGTAYSAQGATAPLSSHFQMGSCQSLKFQPNLKVSTSGKTSRKYGASLDVKLVYPTTPLGANQASSQSNIAQVKVDLPKQLPSRLTTLQKACLAATFEANPAACPPDSRVGTVTASTPVLPVLLTGPAYFVSYGGAKFPELVFVLQGYGVTVDVHAETFINRAGITSSTLRRVPDVPIASFELKLPEGPFSALAANGNLCATTLKLPTAFTGQNGAVIHQSTPIGVTGCPKHQKAGKTKSRKRKGAHGRSK
jgi:hypothetical protein